MRFNPRSDHRTYTFDISAEEYEALAKVEDEMVRILHPTLGDILRSMPGYGRVETLWDPTTRITVEVETVEPGWERLVFAADRIVGECLDDARRLSRFFPDLVEGRPDGKPFVVVYSDEDFVVLKRHGSREEVSIGHARGVTTVDAPAWVLREAMDDEDRRSPEGLGGEAAKATPARSIPAVRRWVASVLPIPDAEALPSASIAGHPVARHVPVGARPVFSGRDWIIAENGEMGISVSFVTEEGSGTRWFLDEAAEQIRDLVRQANTFDGVPRLARFMEHKVGAARGHVSAL